MSYNKLIKSGLKLSKKLWNDPSSNHQANKHAAVESVFNKWNLNKYSNHVNAKAATDIFTNNVFYNGLKRPNGIDILLTLTILFVKCAKAEYFSQFKENADVLRINKPKRNYFKKTSVALLALSFS